MVQTYLQANPDSSRVPPHRQLVRDVNKLQAEAGQAKHRPASDCEPHDGDACSCRRVRTRLSVRVCCALRTRPLARPGCLPVFESAGCCCEWARFARARAVVRAVDPRARHAI